MITFENLPTAVTTLLKEVGELKELFLNQNSQTIPTPEAEEIGGIELPMKITGLAKATIYSKVSKGEIPVNKQGKKLYFSRLELNRWIKDGRKKTNAEIEAEAVDYLNKKKGDKKC